MTKPKPKINPNKVRTRDYLLLELIRGATKAAVHVNRKKKANRNACRRKVRKDDE